ncbi:hypothetical protein [Empedobacter sp. UBA7248]|uniref:hypothetical protein n=1 Tax=Empedobacter sp. UBA7248 TaxID=1946448 RepID=UPI0025C4FAFC|nr:hypothetical protein [Empedobacter sp. UBA7248]
MNEISKLSNSLELTLKDSELQNVSIDLFETLIDSILSEGILKDIPIIGTIVGLTKASINFKDRLFIKKLMYFISEIKEIDIEKRKKMISKIDSSEKIKIKVGEKLIYILDKCDDHIVSQYTGMLFKSFLNEKLQYEDFLRGVQIIQKIYIGDLERFIDSEYSEIENNITSYNPGLSDFQSSLINVGICASETGEINVRDQDDWKSYEKYIVEGGDEIIYLTEIGIKLKNNLSKI